MRKTRVKKLWIGALTQGPTHYRQVTSTPMSTTAEETAARQPQPPHPDPHPHRLGTHRAHHGRGALHPRRRGDRQRGRPGRRAERGKPAHLRRGVIARGLGRSYGDPAQNAGGLVVDMNALDRIHRIDADTALVDVDAGVSLDS